MNEITPSELFEFYLETAKYCNSRVIFQSDEEMLYKLFEEFDSGVRSFFHDDSLQKLFKYDMINESVISTSRKIRHKWIELESKSYSLNEIRTTPEWREFFCLCDELNRELWGDQGVTSD